MSFTSLELEEAGESQAPVVERLPGRWALNQSAHNYVAQAFWRTVLREYTSGHFEDVVRNDRPTQRFDNAQTPDHTARQEA